MRKTYFIKAIITLSLIFTMTACDKEEKKVVIKEPGKTITILDDSDKEESSNEISVEKIDHYKNEIISDWLDEDTVVLSKENETLDKMSLAELSDNYPNSLYLLDITTKDYKLLKEQKDVSLFPGLLSMDKKYLLYSDFSLGDPVYYVMNMDTLESYGLMGDPIGGAITAEWADDDTVIGTAYSGGAYLADGSGKITLIDELKGEALYIVKKIGHTIYYTREYDGILRKLDLTTKEKVEYLERVMKVIPSPDGKQMLLLQFDPNHNKASLLVYDLESGEKISVVEGFETDAISGISWSPDQRLIAYNLKEIGSNAAVRSLYVYDMLTGESSQIAVDVHNLSTSWSPSGEKLACTEKNGTAIDSSIIYLKIKSNE